MLRVIEFPGHSSQHFNILSSFSLHLYSYAFMSSLIYVTLSSCEIISLGIQQEAFYIFLYQSILFSYHITFINSSCSSRLNRFQCCTPANQISYHCSAQAKFKWIHRLLFFLSKGIPFPWDFYHKFMTLEWLWWFWLIGSPLHLSLR